MSKVLVTGGCGFLGSHVCELFAKVGWTVIAYDNMTKFEISRMTFGDQASIRNYNRDYIEKLGIAVINADVRDLKALKKYAQGCSLLINCAAQPTMTLSSEHPIEDFEVNVLGTLNLLEAARTYQISMVTCSTIHIYGNGINGELVEGKDRYYRMPEEIGEEYPTLTGHLTPLHASKRCSEIYIQTYIDTYGVKAAAFRLTGIYGPRQFGSEDHGWVSLLAIKTMLGSPIQLIGTGKQVRDILYVNDAAKAFLMWFRSGCPPGIYNIGGGVKNAISVLQCLNSLQALFGEVQFISPGNERLGDLHYFVCNYTKAKDTFGWEPIVKTEEGLRRLSEWLIKEKNLFHV